MGLIEMNYSNEQIKIIYTAAQELRNEYSVTVEWQESRQLCTDKNKELTETINDRLVPLAYSQDGRVPKMIFAN